MDVASLGRLRLAGVVAVLAVLAVDGLARLGSQSPARQVATVVVLAVTCSAIGWLALDSRGRDVEAQRPVDLSVSLLLLIVSGSALLVYLSPSGAGVLGAFVAARAAAASLPVRVGAAVTGFAVLAIAAATLAAPDPSLTELAVREAGVLAFHGLGLFTRRLRERAADAAMAAERQRIAREMHDVLAHSLSGLAVHLEVARVLAEREDVTRELREAVGQAGQLARAGLSEARSVIEMLRDEPPPGPRQLRRLADEFERRTGCPCRVTITGDDAALGPGVRLAIYRATQEALTNAARHADPERVDVRLESSPVGAHLCVEDRGESRPTAAASGPGYGLSGMRERAELLGGRLRAGPTATGFLVDLWLPAS